MQDVFISGGSGYIGRELIRLLAGRGHRVRALVRMGSERKIPDGCNLLRGDALDAASFAHAVSAGGTYIHLVGVAHPAPWKEEQFRAVDLVALRASATAAAAAGVKHFVFISVAHPAPTMKAYIAVRKECEEILAKAGLTATILRPWYVLGPGHRWPVVLQPFYRLADLIPSMRDGARRLGLVTIDEMVRALAEAVENPPARTRVWQVLEIRAMATTFQPAVPRGASEVPSTAVGSVAAAASATSRRVTG